MIKNRSNLTKLKNSHMKKNRIPSALLALTLITTAAPIAAKESAVKKRFNESLDRLKRCIHLNCSKLEALKAARDVTGAVIALFAAGYGVQKARIAAIHTRPHAAQSALRRTEAIRLAEEAAMWPGKKAMEGIKYATEQLSKWRQGIPTVGQTYNYQGEQVRVIRISKDPTSGDIDIIYQPEGATRNIQTHLDDWNYNRQQ